MPTICLLCFVVDDDVSVVSLSIYLRQLEPYLMSRHERIPKMHVKIAEFYGFLSASSIQRRYN